MAKVSEWVRDTKHSLHDGPIVRVSDVTKTYLLGKVSVQALRGVGLDVVHGEFLAISGPSGSGKTTLLNLIGCIEKPSSGKVRVAGLPVYEMNENRLADLRSHFIGFIFQQFNLLPVLTAFENVEYPLLDKGLSASERKEKVRGSLENMGLKDFMDHKPLELSGGQRQRVAIARAMVIDPVLVLADEPTANLDQKTGAEILDLMKKINGERGTTFIFSTHDPKVLDRASRVVRLADGLIEG